MNQRIKSTSRKQRSTMTYLWIFGLALIVFLLIYFERTEMLYVLATLGVTSLLIIVAVADLGASERSPDAEAAAGINSSPPKLAKK